jgi:hypothetical protein
VMRWTVYPTHAPAYGSQLPAVGAGPTCKMSSSLVMVMVGDVCQGKGSFPGRPYLVEELSSSVAYGILHIANGFLRVGAYP